MSTAPKIYLLLLLTLLGYNLVAQDNPDPTRFEKEINLFQKKDSISGSQKGGVLFLGSSSIRLWKNIETKYKEYGAINRGFGGSHTSDVLYYYDQLVTPYEPCMIIFYEGDNDISHGKSPESILKEVNKFRKRVKKMNKQTQVVFLSAKPSPQRWHLKEKYDTFNSLIEKMSEKKKQCAYLDFWTPLIGENGKPISDLYKSDDLHLNSKGYKIWDDLMISYLKSNTCGL